MHRSYIGWLKNRAIIASLGYCVIQISRLEVKRKLYWVTVRPVLSYEIERRPIKQLYKHKMDIEEMCMLRWMCGHTIRKIFLYTHFNKISVIHCTNSKQMSNLRPWKKKLSFWELILPNLVKVFLKHWFIYLFIISATIVRDHLSKKRCNTRIFFHSLRFWFSTRDRKFR